jgi:alkylation response protein AidB-like acyl-CoA dehydrogenase
VTYSASMAVQRLFPTEEGQDLIDLTREICDKELRPKVDDAERAAATDESFPTEAFRTLGAAGLLSLPHPEEFGGYGQPYEVYLQVVEEIASAWMSVAVGVSVHSLTAYPVTTFGSPQREHPPARHALGRAARRLLPLRAAGRQRCRLDDHPGHRPTTPPATRTGCAVARRGSATPGTPTTTRPSRAPPMTGGKGLSCFIVPGDATRPVLRCPRDARWACTATPCAR